MNTATAITIAALAALTPTITMLIGIILARQDVLDLRAELRAEVGSLRTEMNALRKEIHADLLLITSVWPQSKPRTVAQCMVAVDGIEPSTYGL